MIHRVNFSTFYSLRKSRLFLDRVYRLFLKKKKRLSLLQQQEIERLCGELQTAIDQKQADVASLCVKKVVAAAQPLFEKSIFDRVKNFLSAVGVALFIAILVRQMWFEPYAITSGSMRPTLKESDLLVVSKIPHGINVPLAPSHLYFDPDLVQRGSIVTFTSENMDLDSDTRYFGIIPAKKQLVKRLIGKPGDRLYFYGGKIYGIDREGNELHELLDSAHFQSLEHIPFIRFEGKVVSSRTEWLFHQMNQPIAKMRIQGLGPLRAEMQPGVSEYSDLLGMGHFAMARLLNAKEAALLHPQQLSQLGIAPLYLELIHHPSLQNLHLARDEYGRTRPILSYSTSLLPLAEEEIQELARHMTTCRFEAHDGVLTRFGEAPSSRSPRFADLPNGTYEIQNGVASQIYFQGVSRELPANHPLRVYSMERVEALYNLGIEWDRFYEPTSSQAPFPSRYSYFRAGDLYLLGAPIVSHESPRLQTFLLREEQRKIERPSYLPFKDFGPPLTQEGKFDREKIEVFGLLVPEKSYLVLGDNHAMSGDSRQFGFVPEDNLRGKVSFIFWPFGSRWGDLPQPVAFICTFPHLIVGSLIGLFTTIHCLRQRSLRRMLRKAPHACSSLLP